MKTYAMSLLICIAPIAMLFSLDSVFAEWDESETVNIFISNLDTSLTKKTPEQRKIYYTRTIAQLEVKISQYKEIQKILQKRLSGNETVTPIKSITGIVVDLPGVVEKPIVNTSIFQASECSIPPWESRCISTLTVNAPSGKSFTVVNKSHNITSINLLKPSNVHTIIGWPTPVYIIWESITRNSANNIAYGGNKLELYEWDTRIASTVTLAICQRGAIWNGSNCSNQSMGWVLVQTWEVVIQGNPDIDPVIVPCRNTEINSRNSGCILQKKIQLLSYIVDKQVFLYSGSIIKYSSTGWALLELYGTIGVSDDTSIVLTSSTGKKLYARYTNSKWSWKISNIQTDGFLQDGLSRYTLSFVNDDSSGVDIRIQKLSEDIARSIDPIYRGNTRYGKKHDAYLE